MRLFLSLIIFAAALLSATGQAAAEEQKSTVRSGQTSRIYAGATYNKSSCNGGMLPDFKVRRKPGGGKVSFRKIYVALDPDSGKCAGKKVKGTGIYYTPNRGFRGLDRFSVGFSYFSYDVGRRQKFRSLAFRVTVK